MMNWREQLNRLAVEFWCGIGDLADVPIWLDGVYAEAGEVHPDLWDLCAAHTPGHATSLLLSMARDINRFHPASRAAEPQVVHAFRKALGLFLVQKLSVQMFCALVRNLDAAFATSMEPGAGDAGAGALPDAWWMGDLWNCCDWCDDKSDFDNTPHLVAEARRVLAMMEGK